MRHSTVPSISTAINSLFSELQIHSVLMEVGATGEPPALWREIASNSTYVGIGPASTPTGRIEIAKFQKAHTIEKIVTAHPTENVPLHLMKDTI